MNTITRRTFMAATAASAALAATQGLAARSPQEAARSRCASLHPQMGEQLAMLCDDVSVSSDVKNRALTSAQCPHCNVGITPFGASVGYVRI